MPPGAVYGALAGTEGDGRSRSGGPGSVSVAGTRTYAARKLMRYNVTTYSTFSC